jgi:hypothetical protein
MNERTEPNVHTRRLGLLGAAVCTAGLLAAGTLHASSATGNAADGKPEGAEPTAEEVAVSQLSLAQQLALYAQQNGDAVAAIAAAGIAQRTGIGAAEGAVRGEDGDGDADFPSGPTEMLALARDLAGDRQDLAGLIDDVAESGSRGAIQPGCYQPVQLRANANRVYDDAFYGDQLARVELNGSGNSDVDLYVYDEYGNEICSSTSTGAYESCSWRPVWTGPFQLRVRNYGSRSTVVQVCTN